MITITRIELDEKHFFLKASGHAGGGTAGNDIICAGVSAITQTLLNVLQDEEEAGRIEMEWYMTDGELQIEAFPMSSMHGRIKDYFHMAAVGLKDIAEQYPKNVKIMEGKKNGNT